MSVTLCFMVTGTDCQDVSDVMFYGHRHWLPGCQWRYVLWSQALTARMSVTLCFTVTGTDCHDVSDVMFHGHRHWLPWCQWRYVSWSQALTAMMSVTDISDVMFYGHRHWLPGRLWCLWRESMWRLPDLHGSDAWATGRKWRGLHVYRMSWRVWRSPWWSYQVWLLCRPCAYHKTSLSSILRAHSWVFFS